MKKYQAIIRSVSEVLPVISALVVFVFSLFKVISYLLNHFTLPWL